RKTMKIKKIRENIWTEAVIEKLENREELVAPLWVCTNGTGCWAGFAICPSFTCYPPFICVYTCGPQT
ncbi:MAG: hypothetical protein ACW98X_22260, partial [Promethearchaeota archaeon]